MTDKLTSLLSDPDIQPKLNEIKEWENLDKRHLMHQLEKVWKDDSNIGIGNGLKHINNYIHGTHRGRYYLIGADSGVGKSTLADYMFLLNAYESCKALGRKMYVFYYSFEMSKEEKMTRWISYYIYKMFGEMLPSAYIQKRIKGMEILDIHKEMIRLAYLKVEEMINYCNMKFIEDPQHPTRIYNALVNHHFASIGTIQREKSFDLTRPGRILHWDPSPGEEESMTFLIFDHLGLLASEEGLDTKGVMDRMSQRYFIPLRNIFKSTIVALQQFNTDITSAHRMNKKGDTVVKPQRIDFGDSRYTYRDADVVLGLVKPATYDIAEYMKYNVQKLRHSFVGIHLMKNRHGAPDRFSPIFLNGIVGAAEDLPREPKIDFAMDPYYEQAVLLEKNIQYYKPNEQ